MEPTQPESKKNNARNNNQNSPERKESKFIAGLKKAGFNVWLAVMIIGGALAFITALFLL